MLGGIVHDGAEVAKRRWELFPTDAQEPPPFNPERAYSGGSAPGTHCDICPKMQSEACSLACHGERRKLSEEDGIVVSP